MVTAPQQKPKNESETKMKPTIRKTTETGAPRWVLDYTPIGGKRVRRFFKTEAEAKAAQAEKITMQRRAGESWLALSTAERADLITGYERVKELNLTLNQIIDQWQSGRTASANGNTKPITLRAAGEQWQQFLRTKGNTEMHTANCGRWIRRFAAGREEQTTDCISTDDIISYLSRYSGVTYNGNRDAARSFFGFCEDFHLVSKSPFCGDRIPKRKIVRPGATIFTPEQAEDALRFCATQTPDCLLYVVIGLFAGLRPFECDRLEWSMIDLDRGFMHLPAHITKPRRVRPVHLHPTAVAWIRYCRSLGRDTLGAEFAPRKQAAMIPLREHLGFSEWPVDILRHSFGSYHVELTRDVGATALEMGNSTKMIMDHYYNIVRPEACARYWALTPEVVLGSK